MAFARVVLPVSANQKSCAQEPARRDCWNAMRTHVCPWRPLISWFIINAVQTSDHNIVGCISPSHWILCWVLGQTSTMFPHAHKPNQPQASVQSLHLQNQVGWFNTLEVAMCGMLSNLENQSQLGQVKSGNSVHVSFKILKLCFSFKPWRSVQSEDQL